MDREEGSINIEYADIPVSDQQKIPGALKSFMVKWNSWFA